MVTGFPVHLKCLSGLIALLKLLTITAKVALKTARVIYSHSKVISIRVLRKKLPIIKLI